MRVPLSPILVLGLAFAGAAGTGCERDDNRDGRPDRGTTVTPLSESGRDASDARSPTATTPPPNPNGAGVGATGTGTGGPTNHLGTNVGAGGK